MESEQDVIDFFVTNFKGSDLNGDDPEVEVDRVDFGILLLCLAFDPEMKHDELRDKKEKVLECAHRVNGSYSIPVDKIRYYFNDTVFMQPGGSTNYCPTTYSRGNIWYMLLKLEGGGDLALKWAFT